MRVTVQLDLGGCSVFEPWYGPTDAIPSVGDVIDVSGRGWQVTARIWSDAGSLLTLRCVPERHEHAFYLTRKADQPRLDESAKTEAEN